MNGINKTLFIPLYGKAQISKRNIILKDRKAEEIWEKEAFPITGKAKSKWLTYNMAMRARIFDDWTDSMLRENKNALVLHIGCGLDSRCLRVKENYTKWIDADFPDVISQRKKYFQETANYRMINVDASKTEDIAQLPDATEVIIILEGISMYLSSEELKNLFVNLQKKYSSIHLLMDIYTDFAAKASKYKNPVNEMGVTKLYGIADMEKFVAGTGLRIKREHSLTPTILMNELRGFDRIFFKLMFGGKITRKIYQLYEFETLGTEK